MNTYGGSTANGQKKLMSSLLYDCATHERMQLLPFWMEIFQVQISANFQD